MHLSDIRAHSQVRIANIDVEISDYKLLRQLCSLHVAAPRDRILSLIIRG